LPGTQQGTGGKEKSKNIKIILAIALLPWQGISNKGEKHEGTI